MSNIFKYIKATKDIIDILPQVVDYVIADKTMKAIALCRDNTLWSTLDAIEYINTLNSQNKRQLYEDMCLYLGHF